jgi:type IV secretion system protein VirD4
MQPNTIDYMQSVPSSEPIAASLPPPINSINPSLAFLLLLMGGLSLASLFLSKPKIASGSLASRSDRSRAYKLAMESEAKFWIPDLVGAGIRPPNASGLYFPNAEESVAVIGKAGIGKTLTAINPMLFSAIDDGHSILLYDVKFNLDGQIRDRGQTADLLRTAIERGYEVRFFVPGSRFSGSYSFFDAIKDSSDAASSKELISLLANNLFSAERKKDFFDRAGENLVNGLFLLCRWIAEQRNDPSIANFLMASALIDGDLSKRLVANEAKINPIAYSRFKGLLSAKKSEKQEAGILGVASDLLEPLTYPELIPSYCGVPNTPKFNLDGKPHDPYLMQGKCLFVVGIQKEFAESAIPLAAAVITQVTKRNFGLDRSGPFILGADEISTIHLPLPQWLALERSNKFSALLGLQNYSQLEKRFGDNDARTILGNLGGILWFNPGEVKTAQMISTMADKKEVELVNKTYSSGANSNTSTSTNRHVVDVIPVNDVLQLPKFKAIVQNFAVGNEQSAGKPFYHTFKIHKNSRKFKQDNYEWLDREFSHYYPPEVDRSLAGKLLIEYKKIIDELLPLPQTEAPAEAAAKQPKKLSTEDMPTIPVTVLIQKLTDAGYNVPNYLPDKIPIPKHLIVNNQFIPSLENILFLLEMQMKLNNDPTPIATI